LGFEVRLDRRGEHIAVLGDDPQLRELLLTGAGKHFVAGGDIAFMRSLDRYRAERYVLGVQEMQDALGLLPQPVIAAINGTALGGGCELAMACDIRVADERAIFGQPEVQLGLIPGAGGTQNLPRLVPHGRAKQLLFTGDRISADEALSIGLIDQVVPAGTALDAACALAERIAANAPAAVAAAKRAVNVGLQAGSVDGHRFEASLFGPLVETADFREGTTAFFEKRPADFKRT
jgi:enoyl-CoA hydratase